MLLSVDLNNFIKKFSLKKTVDILSDAGFDAMDFNFSDSVYCDENTDDASFKDSFVELKKYAEDKGMVFNQAHAPMPSSNKDSQRSEETFQSIVRSMRNASYLGVKNIIVHPVTHLPFNEDKVLDKLYDLSMVLYNRLKPYCEEYNIKICVENMYYCNGPKQIHCACSRPDDFIKYVDSLDRKWFSACLDIGHTVLVCEDPADFIRKLGKDRLQALHVHDVDGLHDSHTLPYFGICDWDAVTKALKDIDYQGDFTYEAGSFIAKLPNELCPTAAKHMEATGRYLINKIKN